MPHDHSHHQPHVHEGGAGRGKLAWAMGLNVGFGIFQLVVAGIVFSMALRTDAIHNISDAIPIGLALVGSWLARKAASPDMTTGYGRFEISITVLNYLALISFMIYAIVQSLLRWDDPATTSGQVIGGVAAVAFLMNVGTAWLLSSGKKDLNVKAVFHHQAGDAVSSLGAFATGLLIELTGQARIDPAATILISVFIVRWIWSDFWEAGRLLNGGTPREMDVEGALRYLKGIPSVIQTAIKVFPTDATSATTLIQLSVNPGQAHTVSQGLVEHVLEEFNIYHPLIYVVEEEIECQLPSNTNGLAEKDRASSHGNVTYLHAR